MTAYPTNVAAVLVKYNGQPNPSDCGDYVDEIKLDVDTGSCFILYPEEPNQTGEVLACEVSTYKVDDAGRETDLLLQTIADREFTNVCKLIPGYSKRLKIFTASVPCTPRDAGHDVELGSFTLKLYCRSRCIKDSKLWSPGVDVVDPKNTTWNGGPCQLVCRKGDFNQIQMFYYDRIYEIESGVYIFKLTDQEEIDIIWNTLPVEKRIVDEWGDLNNLVIQPVSFVIVPSTIWTDVFSTLKLVDGEEHFKNKDKRAMSLATYYLNDDTDKLILARIHNDQLKFECMNLQLTLDFMTLLFLTVLLLFLTLLVVY